MEPFNTSADMPISIDTDHELVTDVKPTVAIDGAVVFIRNGREVGRVDAVYDFASINDDPELVALALQLIQTSSKRLHLAS